MAFLHSEGAEMTEIGDPSQPEAYFPHEPAHPRFKAFLFQTTQQALDSPKSSSRLRAQREPGPTGRSTVLAARTHSGLASF